MFRVNHIHLRAPDPKKTARWYVDMFGAEIIEEGEGLGGSHTVRMDIAGTRINITGAGQGEALPEGTADPHFGLEHFGFNTDDIEAAMARLEANGAQVLMPVTKRPNGNTISYIKGPDNVRIELVQPPS